MGCSGFANGLSVDVLLVFMALYGSRYARRAQRRYAKDASLFLSCLLSPLAKNCPLILRPRPTYISPPLEHAEAESITLPRKTKPRAFAVSSGTF
jgi:hypothetical protein